MSALWFDPKRFELRCQTLGALVFLLGALAFLLYWRGNPRAVCIIKA